MKRLLVYVIGLSFLITSFCFAESAYMANLKAELVDKSWTTIVESKADADFSGDVAFMECFDKGELVECRVDAFNPGEVVPRATRMKSDYQGYYEIWKISDKNISHVDHKKGKAGEPYGGTAKTDLTNPFRRIYNVDGATGRAAKTNWNISVNAALHTFNYIVRGYVTDTATTVGTRHKLVFTVVELNN